MTAQTLIVRKSRHTGEEIRRTCLESYEMTEAEYDEYCNNLVRAFTGMSVSDVAADIQNTSMPNAIC